MAITVYGASDDLIEVDGDISEEFGYKGADGHPNTDDGDLLAFSDGTILRITYDSNGVWRITPVVRGSAQVSIEQVPEGDQDGTDRATVDGAVWVVHGVAYAKR